MSPARSISSNVNPMNLSRSVGALSMGLVTYCIIFLKSIFYLFILLYQVIIWFVFLRFSLTLMACMVLCTVWIEIYNLSDISCGESPSASAAAICSCLTVRTDVRLGLHITFSY